MSYAVWNAINDYKVGDIIQSDGFVYKATADNRDSQPPSANWVLFPAQSAQSYPMAQYYLDYPTPITLPATVASADISFNMVQSWGDTTTITHPISPNATQFFIQQHGVYQFQVNFYNSNPGWGNPSLSNKRLSIQLKRGLSTTSTLGSQTITPEGGQRYGAQVSATAECLPGDIITVLWEQQLATGATIVGGISGTSPGTTFTWYLLKILP